MFETNNYLHENEQFLYSIEKKNTSAFKKSATVFAIGYNYIDYWFSFWNAHKSKDISNIPIISISDNGDYFVVADNIYDFIK